MYTSATMDVRNFYRRVCSIFATPKGGRQEQSFAAADHRFDLFRHINVGRIIPPHAGRPDKRVLKSTLPISLGGK